MLEKVIEMFLAVSLVISLALAMTCLYFELMGGAFLFLGFALLITIGIVQIENNNN